MFIFLPNLYCWYLICLVPKFDTLVHNETCHASESLSNPIYSVQYSLLSKLARKPLGISCLCCWLEERFHNYSWELQSNTQWALLLLPINVDRGGNLYEPRGPLLPLPKPSGKHFSTIKGGNFHKMITILKCAVCVHVCCVSVCVWTHMCVA